MTQTNQTARAVSWLTVYVIFIAMCGFYITWATLTGLTTEAKNFSAAITAVLALLGLLETVVHLYTYNDSFRSNIRYFTEVIRG